MNAIDVKPLNDWVSDYSSTKDWIDARDTLRKSMQTEDLAKLYDMYDSWFNQNEIGRMWKCYSAAPETAARKITERYNNNMFAREDFCMLYLCLCEIDRVRNKHTVPRKELTVEEVKKALDIYFTAHFRGIGQGNVFNSYDLLIPRLMLPRETVKEQATIALMIYNKKRYIMTSDAPQSFMGWYKRLCEVLGWTFNDNYKPNKLTVTDALKDEFYFLR